MKKLFTIILVAATIVCAAQPTITSSVVGGVGDSFDFTQVTTTGFDPGPTGAGVTWDFSGISTSGAANIFSYVTPASTGQAGSFPGANLAADIGGGNYAFYKSSSSELAVAGVYTVAATVFYSDFEQIMIFPATYNTTNSDHLHSEFTNGVDFIRDGDNELVADGYGTLILPTGTFTNVLRVKLVEDYGDIAFGLPVTFEYHFEDYYWYAEGIKGPIFEYFNQDIVAGGTPSSSESYAINNNAVPGSSINITAVANCRIYPNPVTTDLIIKSVANTNLQSAEIFDVTGKLILTQDLTDITSNINVADLSAGMYLLEIHTDNGVQTETFVKQ